MSERSFKQRIYSVLLTIYNSIIINELNVSIHIDDTGNKLIIKDKFNDENGPICTLSLSDDIKNAEQMIESAVWTNYEDGIENIYDKVSDQEMDGIDNAFKALGLDKIFPTSFKEFITQRQSKKSE